MRAVEEISELLSPLREPIARVRAHWWVPALAAASCAGAALIVSMLMPPTWRAITTVRIRTTEAQVFNFSGIEGSLKGYQDRERRFQTMQALLRSRSTMQGAAERLVADGYPVEAGASFESQHLRGLVSISQEEGTEVVRIAADHSDEDWARKIAQAVAESFENVARSKRREQAESAFKFLDERAAGFKDELFDSEDDLDAFRKAKGTIELDQEHRVLADQVASLEHEVMATARSVRNLDDEIDEVDQLLRSRGVVAAARWFDDDALAHLVSSWQEAELQAKIYRAKYQPNYVPLKEAEEQLQATLEVLSSSVNAMVERRRARLRLDTERLAKDRNELADLRTRTQELEAELGRYEVLVSERNLRRNFYKELASRYTQVGLDSAIAEEGVQIIDEAHVLPYPVSPRTKFNFVVGLFLGAALGLALVILREREAAPLRSVRDVEAIIGGQVLAAIPRLDNEEEEGEPALVVGRQDVGVLAETMRELRSALAEKDPSKGSKVVLVTSALPSEGKTMVSSSLALSYGRAGQRTLLVDTDLRRPRVRRVFGIEGAQALNEYLMTHKSRPLSELVVATEFAGVDLLTTAGNRAPPIEALAGQKLRDLITEARTTYDQVILDTPPILSVVDAALMAHLADGIIVVVNPSRVAQNQLTEAVTKLGRLAAPLLGAVVNGADRNSGYGYEYGYRYAYKYQYRYGSDYAEDEEKADGPPAPRRLKP